MMKYILTLLLFIPYCSFAQNNNQYLVTQSNDTVFYHGDLIVNHDDIAKWRNITADSMNYAVRDIKCVYFNQQMYYNCDGKRLYKQLIQGDINLYALHNRDTFPDRKGNLNKHVFIQHQQQHPILFSTRNLRHMIATNDSTAFTLEDMQARRNGGNAMIISGVSLGAPTVVLGLMVAAFAALSSDKELSNNFLIVAAAGAFTGASLIGGGLGLKSGTKQLGLSSIHLHNALADTPQ